MKNLQLLKKINMFHKFAIEFVQQIPHPNTFTQDMQPSTSETQLFQN